MKQIKIILFIIAFILPFNSHAGSFKIEGVSPIKYRVQSNGSRFSVTVNPGEITQFPSNCTSSSSHKVFYVLNGVAPFAPADAVTHGALQRETGYDQMFATIMLAKATNSKITVWIDDTTCSSSLPIATLISLD